MYIYIIYIIYIYIIYVYSNTHYVSLYSMYLHICHFTLYFNFMVYFILLEIIVHYKYIFRNYSDLLYNKCVLNNWITLHYNIVNIIDITKVRLIKYDIL